MKTLRFVLVAAILMLSPVSAFALVMGFNADIHNGTGQDAYDFHIEGILKSSKVPVQLNNYVYPKTAIAGFDWTYDGGTITPLSGNYYKYSGGWSGSVPVPPSSTVHFGKYWDEECHNIFVELTGWWTDENGDKIVPDGGGSYPYGNDAPLVGFEVLDQILEPNPLPQTLELQNWTGNPLSIQGLQIALTEDDIRLEDLVEDSSVLEALLWQTVGGPLTLDQGSGQVFDLAEFGVIVPPRTTLITRFWVEDPTDGIYRFSAHRHTSHIPEPTTFVMAIVGLMSLAVFARRRQ